MTTYSMIQRSKHLCILCLTSLLACACSTESDVPADDILVPLNIGSVSLEAETTHTRSATAMLTNGTIGLFLRENGSLTTNSALNEAYTTSNGTAWSGKTLYVSSKPSAIAAYYPRMDEVITGWTLPLTAQTYTSDKDLVYDCSQSVDAANPGISFRMKHAYGRLKIQMKRGTYDGTGEVTAASLYYYVNATTFDLSTNTYSNQNGTVGKTVEKTGITQKIGADAAEIADFLLPPCIQTYTTNSNYPAEFHCTIDGGSFKAQLPTTYLPAAGVCKVLTVTVNGKGLAFTTNINVTDWTTETDNQVPTWD